MASVSGDESLAGHCSSQHMSVFRLSIDAVGVEEEWKPFKLAISC